MSLSPLPHIGEVTGKATRDDEQRVDTNIVAIPGIAWREPLGGHGDPAQPIFVERPCRRLRGAALLDFYEGNYRAAAGDEVDFATRNAGSTGENPPAV